MSSLYSQSQPQLLLIDNISTYLHSHQLNSEVEPTSQGLFSWQVLKQTTSSCKVHKLLEYPGYELYSWLAHAKQENRITDLQLSR